MKKMIIPMLFIGIALMSCSKKEHETEQDISAASLPKSVVSYVENNYPAESIYKAVEFSDSHAKYVVTLTSDEEVTFDENGSVVPEGQNHGHHGNHEGHHHGKGHHHDEVPSDSLSTTIKDYVATNFAGYTIRHAEKDSLCAYGKITEVMIFKSSSEPLKLYFNASDEFLMQGTRFSSSDLPQVIKTTITTNYADYSVREKSEKFILADNISVEYFVFLYQGDIHKQLILKEDGTLVCEQ